MSYNGSGVFTINTTGQPVVTGTTISSTVFNTLTADLATGLTTALTKDGQSTPTANIKLGAFKITNLGAATLASDAARLDQIQGGGSTFVTAAGTDTITGTTSPTLTAYATGNQFSFVVANTNTGAVTINVDALGAKAITRTGTTALVAGDMVAGQVVEIIYDGTQFQLVNGNSFTNLKVSGTLAVTGVATLVAPVLGTPTSVTLTNATGLPPAGVVGTAAILGANTFTAAQEWATGTAIASAATINLDTSTGNRVHITGTTTITAVTLTRGPRTVIFDGILTLTHHATTNNLPGAANITTAAGDRAIYESDGTTVYCVSYVKVSGVATVVASSVPTVIRSARTANTIIGVADQGSLIDVTSGTFSQTFTAAATLGSGWWAYIGNSGTGFITLDPNAAETITRYGVATATWALWPGEMGIIQCNGTGFYYYPMQLGQMTTVVSTAVASISWATGVAYRRKVSITCNNVALDTAGRIHVRINTSTEAVRSGVVAVSDTSISGSADGGDFTLPDSSSVGAAQTGDARLYATVVFDLSSKGINGMSSTRSQDTTTLKHSNSFGFWSNHNETNITDYTLIPNVGLISAGTFTIKEL